MRSESTTLLLSAAAGLLTGLRSLTPPAFLSHHIRGRRGRYGQGPAGRLLGAPPAAGLLSGLAVGEMVADKTPFIPDRTTPLALMGRAMLGGVCGAAIAERRGGSPVGAALVGAVAAVGGAYLGYAVRQAVGARTAVPDALLGLAEDAVVVAGAAQVVSRLTA